MSGDGHALLAFTGFGHFRGCDSPTCDGSCYDDHANLAAARNAVYNFRGFYSGDQEARDLPQDPFWLLSYNHVCERLHRPPTFEAFLADCWSAWNAEAEPQRRAVDLGRR